MATLERAIEIAHDAHKNQLDISGNPYILHPLKILSYCNNEDEKICAILHDVVEDNPLWTLERLQEEGFSEKILKIIDLLTKKKDEKYSDYIDRVKTDTTAIKIKILDLSDNLDLKRLNTIEPEYLEWLNRYLKYYRILIDIL